MYPDRSSVKHSENDTIARAKAGDNAAFAELYRRYSKRVFGVCFSLVRDVTITEDLVQESFLRAYRKLDTFREDSLFSTWLHRIAVNSALMYLRKRSSSATEISLNEPTHDDGAEEIGELFGSQDAVLNKLVDRVTLQRAIESLPPGYRAVVVLHDVEGYQHDEIAEILGCTIGNTKSQLHKARLKLRALLTSEREVEVTQKAA